MTRRSILGAAALAVACGVFYAAPSPAGAATTSGTSGSGATIASVTLCRRAVALQQAAIGEMISAIGGAGNNALLARSPLSCGSPPPAPHTRGAAHGATRSYHRYAPARAARAAHARASTQPLHLPAYAPLGSASGALPDSGSLLSLAAKFVAVLVLLFLCLRVLRMVMPRLSGNGRAAAGAMVLHSEVIGEKQRVQLLDLEVRLVLIAVAGGNITALATIDDDAEMALLRARYQSKPRNRAAASVEAHTDAERPSFATALVSATRQKMPGGAATDHAVMRTRPTRAARPSAGQSETAPALGRALETMRALRHRAEQL